jgi:hypothetical protein
MDTNENGLLTGITEGRSYLRLSGDISRPSRSLFLIDEGMVENNGCHSTPEPELQNSYLRHEPILAGVDRTGY